MKINAEQRKKESEDEMTRDEVLSSSGFKKSLTGHFTTAAGRAVQDHFRAGLLVHAEVDGVVVEISRGDR